MNGRNYRDVLLPQQLYLCVLREISDKLFVTARQCTPSIREWQSAFWNRMHRVHFIADVAQTV